MGQEPNKYHVTKDGKVFEICEDGAVTELGEIADLKSKYPSDKDNTPGESQKSLLKSEADNPVRDKIKEISIKENKPKRKRVWLILSILALITLSVSVFLQINKNSNSAVSDSLAEHTFINTQPFPSDTTNLEVVWVNNTPIHLRHIKGGNFKGRIQTEDVDGQKFFISDSDWKQYDMSVNNFTITLTEVTQELWRAVMNESFSQYLSRISKEDRGIGDKLPVYYISLEDAKIFIEKLNNLTGKQFRLPTSKEWIYAQMGGDNTIKVVGLEAIDKVAWFDKNSNGMYHKVATKLPNKFGLYDMIGNVYEWTTLRENDYENWCNFPYDCHIDDYNNCFLQNCWRVSGRESNVGFRLVLE